VGDGILWKSDLPIHIKVHRAVGYEPQERASSVSAGVALHLELTDETQRCSGVGLKKLENPVSCRHGSIMPAV